MRRGGEANIYQIHLAAYVLLLLHWFRQHETFTFYVGGFPLKSPTSENLVVVGGGISGLVVGHVLSASSRYNVTLLEANSEIGGHIRSLPDPQSPNHLLNIGHATHMGMFVNLRIMLKHLKIQEWPVGRGPNETPGLFRMLSVSLESGHRVQPPMEDILRLSVWWEAFKFYFASYLEPEIPLEKHLKERQYSDTFLDVLHWATATFEFDKCKEEMRTYSLGAARALLITQVFFQYLLCDAFQGSLPEKIDSGLKQDLAKRISKERNTKNGVTIIDDDDPTLQELKDVFQNITEGTPLASYFTADYNAAASKLAAGIDQVRTGTVVSSVKRNSDDRRLNDTKRTILVETMEGEILETEHVIFATHPSIIPKLLNKDDFVQHQSALQSMNTGAVGVKIIHASNLPFEYPPCTQKSLAYSMEQPPSILGIFDISQLTRIKETGEPATMFNASKISTETFKIQEAGYLSVAHPVYVDKSRNIHNRWLQDVACIDSTVYPWTVATPSFLKARHRVEELQGKDGIYIIGQALTGVNKASELQVTNALLLCRRWFGVNPLWRCSYLYPMLPDCNDNDATYQAQSLLEAAKLALKSLVGSFVLTGAVSKVGVKFFA